MRPYAAFLRFMTMRVFAMLAFVSIAYAAPKLPALEPMHIRWDMTPDAAYAALDKAKLSPRHDERRGYFSDAGGVSHTTEPELHWKIPKGRAEARFQWSDATKGWRLDEVQLFTDLTDLALQTEVASLERRYGKPHKTTADHRLWVRGGIWLVVIPAKAADPKTNLWSLSVHYRRDARPAP